MTNHNCHGDRFTIGGNPFYRCFLDGQIVLGLGVEDEPCPNCERTVKATDLGQPETRTITTTQFLHPVFGWLDYYELQAAK